MSKSQKTNPAGELHAEVAARFGVLPNFFTLAPSAPAITESLWDFAKFGYLDNPLPALFKERLFVSLSQFCDVRYCISRHVGFLVGLGRPSGAGDCPPQTAEQAMRLLSRPMPYGEQLEPHLKLLEERASVFESLPADDTVEEVAIIACATHVFLQTASAPRALEALSRAFEPTLFQYLLVFLTFVRMAHFWTELHPELQTEEDIDRLFRVQEALAECVLRDRIKLDGAKTAVLLEELEELRGVREQAELMRVTLRSIGDAVIATDMSATITSFNSAASEISGWTANDAIGQPLAAVFRIISENTRAPVPSPVVRALKEGVIVGLTTHALLITKDGTEVPIEDSAAPIRSTSGAIMGCVLVFRDVTERRDSERSLVAQSSLLRMGAEVGMALTTQGQDLQAMLQACSESIVRNLGAAFARIWTLDVESNVLVLQASAGIYTHLDGDHARVPVGSFKIGLIAHEKRPHLTNEVIGDPQVPNQQWAEREGLVAFAGYPLMVGDSVLGVIGMFAKDTMDETAFEALSSTGNEIALALDGWRQRMAERAALASVRQSRELLRTTLASIGDGVITTDAGGQITFLNEVAEDLCGYARAEVIGAPLGDVFCVVDEESREPVANPAFQALQEGAIVGLTNHSVLLSKDGSAVAIDDSAAPIRSEDGKIVGAVLVFRDVTERRRAELEAAERERSAHLLAAIIATSDDAIISKGLDGMIRTWNSGAERLFGYTSEEAIGRPVVMLIPPDRASEEDTILTKMRAGKRVLPFDTVRLRADGVAIDVSVSISPIKDAKGRTVGASKIARDIRKRKQAENERTRLVSVVESSSDFIGISDTDAKPLFVNRAGRELVGVPPDVDLSKTRIDDYFAAEQRELIDSVVVPAMLSVGRWSGELTFCHFQTDELIPVWCDLFRIDHPVTGKPLNFATVTRDLRAQKRAAADLTESEARTQLALESAEMGTWHVDLATLELSCDARFREISGIVSEQPSYEDALHLAVHSEDRGRVREAIEAATRTEGALPYAIEYRVSHPSGEIRWVFAKGRTTIGRVWGAIRGPSFDGTIMDVTEQKVLRSQLEETAARLADADQRKDEFLATLAHELRNPLAPIRSGLDALRLTTDKSKQQRIQQTMERQTEHMVRLVDDLLDVSRITQGKLQLQVGRVELKEVVEVATESVQLFIAERGHELIVSLPDQPVVLDADSARLAQVLSNLLNNAAKYTTRPGTIWLTATCENNELSITVKDTGLGIREGDRKRIFEMFGQVDRSLESGYTGLGIGLMLVRRLVEMHQGSVEVASEGENRGSEFTVRLPIPVGVKSPDAEATSAPAFDGTLRVLVVDDNIDALDLLEILIETLGHTVRTAQDGQEALEAAEEFRPHVVLMDIGMPKLNGYAAAKHIRQQPWGKDMLLAAVSGWGQASDIAKGAEAGFDHHIVKPVGVKTIREVLREAADRLIEGSAS